MPQHELNPTGISGSAKWRKFTYLTGLALLYVILALSASEFAKYGAAKALGYKTTYSPLWARSYYGNQEMNAERDLIVLRYDYDDRFFSEDSQWLAYTKKRDRHTAIIQLTGRLFLWLISAIGLTAYFARRRRNKIFGINDAVYLFLGLFFMRDVVFDILYLVFGLGNAHEVWLSLGLPSKTAYIYIISALIFFVYILFRIPKKLFLVFALSLMIGSSGGAIIWYTGMAKIFPSLRTFKEIKKEALVKDFTARVQGSNETFSFSDYKDSIVLFDFMFSTCAPCRRSIPHINKLYDKYRPKGVVFYGVDPFEKDWVKLGRFLELVEVKYPILKINEGVSNQTFGVRNFPTIVVTDKGRVKLIIGGHESSVPKIEAALESALQ